MYLLNKTHEPNLLNKTQCHDSVLMQSGPAHSANGTMLRQQLRAGCNDLQPDKCKTCSQIDDDVDDDDEEEDCRTDFPGCITR